MIERNEYLQKLISFKDKKLIKVISGIRRCGKSTLLELFKDYLLNKHIIIYDELSIPNIVMNILSNYEYEVINEDSLGYKHDIYEFNNIDSEIAFVATKCIELINRGTDINNIYLMNLNDEYRLLIKRIFGIFTE